MTDPLEALRTHAHHLSLRIMTVAGLMTGLLLGIGLLFLGQSLRTAVALWALMLAVGALMVMLGHHVRRQADDLFVIGSELRTQQNEALRRTAEASGALGDLRARLSTIEQRLSTLEDDVSAPSEAAPDVADLTDVGPDGGLGLHAADDLPA